MKQMPKSLKEQYVKNLFSEDYDTPALIVRPNDLKEYGLDLFIDIAEACGIDTIAEKCHGDIRGVRFVDSKYRPTEKFISQEGNHYTTLGEGLYMYNMESSYVRNRYLKKDRICLYLDGKDIDYYHIVWYNDGDKSDEILIPSHEKVEVLNIFDNKDSFENYCFN